MPSELQEKYLNDLQKVLENVYDVSDIPEELIHYFNVSDAGYLLGNEEVELTPERLADILHRTDINIDLYDKLINVFLNTSKILSQKIDLYMQDMYSYEVYVDRSTNISYNPFINLKSYPIEIDIDFFIDDENIVVNERGGKYLVSGIGNSNKFKIKFTNNIEITRFIFPMINVSIDDVYIEDVTINYREWGSYYIFDKNVPASDITLLCKFVSGDSGIIISPKFFKDEYIDVGILTSKFGSELNFFGGNVLDFFLVGKSLFYKNDHFSGSPFPIWMSSDDHILLPVFTVGDIDISSGFTITNRYAGGSLIEGVGNPSNIEYDIIITDDTNWYFVYSDGRSVRVRRNPPQNYYSFAIPSLSSSAEIDILLNSLNVNDITTMFGNTITTPNIEESEYVAS